MKRTLIAAACIGAFSMAGGAQAGLVVTPTADGETLVNTIIGTGVTVTPGSINYIGVGISDTNYDPRVSQAGTFTGGLSAGIGIDEGIILTSGSALLAPGPNDNDGASAELGTAGDVDLSNESGEITNDANVLEFMFETDTSDLFFNFVFASEEYNEYVFDFNDPFAFFLDGVNIALVPGTTDVVSVDNVNCGNPYNPPLGGNNCDKYNNNDLDDGGPFFDIQYDGFTNVFTATAVGLDPGPHRIKLVIADAGDTALDSAVFIEAGTFSGEPPTPNPAPGTALLIAAGLGLAGAVRRGRRKH
jgi:hypothetical protein